MPVFNTFRVFGGPYGALFAQYGAFWVRFVASSGGGRVLVLVTGQYSTANAPGIRGRSDEFLPGRN
jgi:hypothetical protein